MATLSLDHVNFALRSFELELSLEVGSTLALVGPSGAGKTTVLRAVAGLTRPKAGRIAVDDEVWFDGEPGRRPDAGARDGSVSSSRTTRSSRT